MEYSQKFLQCIKYIILKFIPSAALFHPLSLIPGTVSTGLSNYRINPEFSAHGWFSIICY
jgi:hypothetical protein